MRDRVAAVLDCSVVSEQSVGGGCIADSRRFELADGRFVFAKQVCEHPESLCAEARGLNELAQATGGPHTPEVLHVEPGLLVLSAIAPGCATDNGWERFGSAFAALHQTTRVSFGFAENNWIGASPQQNIVDEPEASDWVAFYWTARLEPQFRRAEAGGHASSELRNAAARIERCLPDLLAGTEEPPALLHGDLWSGNVLWNANCDAVIIDPAVYYGHREADLGMTFLFGGFPPAFYDAYQAAYPLPDGWRDRIALYELYHQLNHLNLFGSGYLAGVLARCARYA